LGTTGNKAAIFDDEGNLVSSAFSGYKTYYPGDVALWLGEGMKYGQVVGLELSKKLLF